MDYRVDSQTGGYIFDTAPISTEDLKLRNEEIDWLVAHGRKQWGLINGRLATRGKWVDRDYLRAGQASYGVLGANPPAASFAGLATTTSEQNFMVNQAVYTPVPANQQFPQSWMLKVTGVWTMSSTAGTVTMTPRFGNAATSSTFGTSGNQTITASLTNAVFYIEGDITMRTSGLAGAANASATGYWTAMQNTAVNGATTAYQWANGTTATTFDPSLTAPGTNGGAIWLGITGATAHATWTIQQVIWLNWN